MCQVSMEKRLWNILLCLVCKFYPLFLFNCTPTWSCSLIPHVPSSIERMGIVEKLVAVHGAKAPWPAAGFTIPHLKKVTEQGSSSTQTSSVQTGSFSIPKNNCSTTRYSLPCSLQLFSLRDSSHHVDCWDQVYISNLCSHPSTRRVKLVVLNRHQTNKSDVHTLMPHMTVLAAYRVENELYTQISVCSSCQEVSNKTWNPIASPKQVSWIQLKILAEPISKWCVWSNYKHMFLRFSTLAREKWELTVCG